MKRFFSLFLMLCFFNVCIYTYMIALTSQKTTENNSREISNPLKNIILSRSAKGIRVLWNKDLLKEFTHLEIAREPAFADGTKIIKVDRSSYTDKDVEDSKEYKYSVSVVDNRGNKTLIRKMTAWYGSRSGTALAGSKSRVEYEGFNLAFKGTEFKSHKKVTIRISPNSVEEESLIQASDLYEIKLEDEEQPITPVTAEIFYSTINMPKGYSEKDLKVFLRHNAQTSWEKAKIISIDKDNKVVYAMIPHFSEVMAGFVGVPEGSQTRANVNTALPKIKLPDPFFGKMKIQPSQPEITGALGQSIPVVLPVGKAGMTPEVSLVYNSDQKNGLCGFGWALAAEDSISYVKKNGTYIYTCSAGDLVSTSPGVFRLKFDNSFARYEYNSTENTWMVTKDGIVSYYGENGAKLTNNLPGVSTKQWLLTRKVNQDSVAIQYNYSLTSGNEQILTNISYDHFNIQMVWEARSDTNSYTSAFGNYSMEERLSHIRLMDTLNQSGINQLDREYVLTYNTNDVGISLLTNIELRYNDGTSLSKVSMTYKTNNFNQSIDTASQCGNIGGPIAEDEQRLIPLDVNGDGLQDIVVVTDGTADATNGKFKVYINNGKGYKASQTFWHINDGIQNIDSFPMERIQFIDMNGDGLPDIVANFYAYPTGTEQSTWKVFINTGQGFAYNSNYTLTANIDPSRFSVRDMDGDGRPDFVLNWTGSGGTNSGIILETHTNKTTGIEPTAVNWCSSATSDLAMIKLIDFSGDGLPDLMVQNNSNTATCWAIYRNTGLGFSTTSNLITIPKTDSQYIQWMDINGDGLQELVVNNHDSTNGTSGSVTVYRNNGTTFSSTPEIWAIPVLSPYKTSYKDVNGDGRPDILVNRQDNSIKQDIWLNTGSGFVFKGTIDLLGTDKQDIWLDTGSGFIFMGVEELLGSESSSQYLVDINGDGGVDSVINNPDGTVTVYQGRQNFNYLLDTMEANQMIISYDYDKVNNGLGYAKTVLKKTTVKNELPSTDPGYYSYSTCYSYEQGKYDRQNRVMYGFGKITASDILGNTTVTYFDQTAEEMIGHTITNETYAGSMPIPLPSQLTTYCLFNGDANDSSGNSHNGVVSGSPTFTTGMRDKAILLSGTGDYVTLDLWSQGSKMWGQDELSIDFWAKPNSVDQNNRTLLDFHKGNGNSYLRLIQKDPATISISGLVTANIPYNWDTSQFHHFVITASTMDMSIYIDGSKVFNAAINYTSLNTAIPYELVIGGEWQYTSSYKWSGAIDELSIWSTSKANTSKLTTRTIYNYRTQTVNNNGYSSSKIVLLTDVLNTTISLDQVDSLTDRTEYQYYGIDTNSASSDINSDYLLYRKIDRQKAVWTGSSYFNPDTTDDVYQEYNYTPGFYNNNIIPKPYLSEVYMMRADNSKDRLGLTQYYYVGAPTLGTISSRDLVSKKNEWNGTNGAGIDKWLSISNRYDTVDHWRLVGTSLFTNNILIKTTDYKYDNTMRFVTNISNTYTNNDDVVVETLSSILNPVWGFPYQEIDNNGQTNSYRYDTANRLIASYTPGDHFDTSISQVGLVGIDVLTNSSNDRASTLYDYGLGNNNTIYTKALKRMNRNDNQSANPFIEEIAFLDGMGRTLQTKTGYKDPLILNKSYVVSGKTTYDLLGRVIQSCEPTNTLEPLETYHLYGSEENTPVTTTSYDDLGRVIMTIKGSEQNQITNGLQYIGLYNAVSYDGEGNIKETVLDQYGRVSRIIDFANKDTNNVYATIDYSYDSRGNLTNTTDIKGNRISVTYDNLSRKISMNDPDIGKTTYEYDDLGRLIETTDAKGQIKRNEYDVAGRLTSESYDNGVAAPTISYTYGADPQTNNNGRLISVNDGSGEEKYYYNLRGEATETHKTIDGVTYISGKTYDALGRISTLTYPHLSGAGTADIIKLKYTYEPNSGLLQSIDQIDAGTDQFIKSYLKNIDYDVMGRRTSMTYGNDVTTTYHYDPVKSLLSSCSIENSQLSFIKTINYTFDNVGNPKSKDDPYGITEYQYDNLYRLTQTEFSAYGAGPQDANYIQQNSYDELGNILSKGANQNYSYNSSRPHAVTGFTGPYQSDNSAQYSFAYDTNGNMTQESISYLDSGNTQQNALKTFSWNGANQLSGLAQNGTNWSYTYDYSGERTKKVKNDGQFSYTTVYVSGMAQFKAGGPVYAVFDGVNRIASISKVAGEDKVFFIHTDNVGSATLVTDNDGNEYRRIIYNSFGEIYQAWSSSSSWHTPDSNELSDIGSYAFTGQELDAETGLCYYGARYYDANIGRFISPDSYIDGGGLGTQGFNRYSYVGNNPICYYDPSGNEGESDLPAEWTTPVDTQVDIGNIFPHGQYYDVGKTDTSFMNSDKPINYINDSPINYTPNVPSQTIQPLPVVNSGGISDEGIGQKVSSTEDNQTGNSSTVGNVPYAYSPLTTSDNSSFNTIFNNNQPTENIGYFSGSVLTGKYGLFTGDRYKVNYSADPLGSIGKDIFYYGVGVAKTGANMALNGVFGTLEIADNAMNAVGLTENVRNEINFTMMSLPPNLLEAGTIPLARLPKLLRGVATASEELSTKVRTATETGGGIPTYFSKMISERQARDLLRGETISLAGKNGAGFIGDASELSGITTKQAMKEAMGVPYNPDYLLEFQLKDTTGLQNLLKYDDPFWRYGGKTLSGFSEFNMPGLNSDNIINWTLRSLK